VWLVEREGFSVVGYDGLWCWGLAVGGVWGMAGRGGGVSWIFLSGGVRERHIAYGLRVVFGRRTPERWVWGPGSGGAVSGGGRRHGVAKGSEVRRSG